MARIFFSILPFCITIIACHDLNTSPPKFLAVLIFSDSTVDTDNNNYINTLLKADYSLYCVDYSDYEAMSHFSDRQLMPDMLVSKLGIKKSLPPFLNPFLLDDGIKTGVSITSVGFGIDDLTMVAAYMIPVLRWLSMFKNYINRVKSIVGDQEANNIISNALILISAETNDFLFNWYDIPSRRSQFRNISAY